jgi:hypothetical protein
MNQLPPEILNVIISQISSVPIVIIESCIREQCRDILNIMLICRSFRDHYSEDLANLLSIIKLIKKYNVYHKEYEIANKDNVRSYLYAEEDIKSKPMPPPVLYDALLTGCRLPYAKSTFSTFNDSIREDIKIMIRLMPHCIFYQLGELRCRRLVTPLCAACINPNIPIEIIKFLFENNANPEEKIRVNCNNVLIIHDLKDNITEQRYSEICDLFSQYQKE